jgi:hypothetical protein
MSWCGLPWSPPPSGPAYVGRRRRRRLKPAPIHDALERCAVCYDHAAERCARCGQLLCAEHVPGGGDERCDECERGYRARTVPVRVAAAIPVGIVGLGVCGFAAMVAAFLLNLPASATILLVLLSELAGGALFTRQVDRLLSRLMRQHFLGTSQVALPEARLLGPRSH